MPPQAAFSMISAVAARTLFRSPSLGGATARAGSSRTSLFHAATNLRRPAVAPHFLRSPVEACFCVESLLPIHSATASALMTSMLAVSRRGYGWLSEAGNDDV